MKYMLDTNICIYMIKKHPSSVVDRLTSLRVGDVCISSITLAELLYGTEKSEHRRKNQEALEQFVLPLQVAPFEENAAVHYGEIRATLEKRGELIGGLDLLIAAHARSLRVPLITNNKREFARVPELEVQDWVESHR